MVEICLMKWRKTTGLILGLSLFLMLGCQSQRSGISSQGRPSAPLGKVVCVGFFAALGEKEKADVTRNPVSDALYPAEPVSSSVTSGMTEHLFRELLAKRKYDLVPPDEAKGVLSERMASEEGARLKWLQIFQEIGIEFKADAVLVGYIYRWNEREGSDFAAERPASVAFDLYLIRPEDGRIIWKGKFDKKQKSLSENVFDIRTFFRGGGRWLTAEKLAVIGLQDLIGAMPASRKEIEDLEV